MANPQQGKGFASASLSAIVGYASTLWATDVFAGVNHGNTASRRVLEKGGFNEAVGFDTYTRFHREIDPFG